MLKVTHIPRYTYDDYKLWNDDWELIDGYPYSMSPSASGKHQSVSGELFFQMKSQLVNPSCKKNCHVYYELDWILNNNTVVRPDIAIVCGEKNKGFIENIISLVLPF